ncbi:unnamed protein product [Cylicocyclus nassatus]|uniref:Tetraspanin n=1 Tax=Cylicocyclus nassatus TaxID=53992 RepID=A0AA36HGE4_CYLNA|nr:unnamed protein product [Cylicocyclus nassatus]
MANYKQWIYSVNCSLIVVEIILIGYIIKTFSEDWWHLIPTGYTHPLFIFYFILIGIQFFTCVCGLVGVLISNSCLLSAYWLFMVPLLITDGVMIIPFVEHFSGIHRSIADHIHNITTEQVKQGTAPCHVWNEIQTAHNCCSPRNIHGFCHLEEGWNRPKQCASGGESCVFPILRMMHKNTDIIGMIIYYVLVPLKFVVVFVLRKDVRSVFSQILYKKQPVATTEWDWTTTNEDDVEMLEDVYSNYSTKRSIGPELAAIIAHREMVLNSENTVVNG